MVSRGAGTGPAERWRCGHGDMVMRVRCQRAHRCKTLTYPQASPSGRLSTDIELIVAHRGHIVDRAPRSLGGPRLYGETLYVLYIPTMHMYAHPTLVGLQLWI